MANRKAMTEPAAALHDFRPVTIRGVRAFLDVGIETDFDSDIDFLKRVVREDELARDAYKRSMIEAKDRGRERARRHGFAFNGSLIGAAVVDLTIHFLV